jgi:hypothetical protein
VRRFASLMVILFFAGAAQGQTASPPIFPNRQLTPGSVDPSLTPSYLCSHPTSDRRRVPDSLRKKVFAAYHVPISAASKYEVDHFIPLALGGVNTCTDNPTCNLWPEPHQKSFWQIAPGGSETKDVLEGTLYRTMCNKHVAVKDSNWLNGARFAMTSNWQSAYQKYVGGTPGAETLQAKPARKSTRRIKH